MALDGGLTRAQRDTVLLVTRRLDDVDWVMSSSRWKDPAFRPAFHAAVRREHPELAAPPSAAGPRPQRPALPFSGISRYEPHAAYARGLADLAVPARQFPAEGDAFGPAPTRVDAAIFGFIATILFSDIETPLRRFTGGAAEPRAALPGHPRRHSPLRRGGMTLVLNMAPRPKGA
ncbi:hypothetical protein [Ancylobacter vacuolatus]|uniref:Glutathione S-transferase n=1 Tax=Ancylobacter vacuolatus TaxID=223389 RepID=A0ABU0DHT4_9HYPH|nr:hypothetical protein [Ancylobacter vacuolatus]MDQ0347878.1 hypothetical protein [Ancylobacter vacuolatus]